MIELEVDCDRCNGDTYTALEGYNGSPRRVCCLNCNGTGKQPSEEGQRILDFISKYLVADHIRLVKRS